MLVELVCPKRGFARVAPGLPPQDAFWVECSESEAAMLRRLDAAYIEQAGRDR